MVEAALAHGSGAPPKEQQRKAKKEEAEDHLGPMGFPSTAAVATAPYRAKVLEQWNDETVHKHVEKLHDAAHKVMHHDEHDVVEAPVPALRDHENRQDDDCDELRRWFVHNGGWWVVPETWDAGTLVQKHRMRGPGAQRPALDPVKESKVLESTGAEDEQLGPTVEKARRTAEELTEAVGTSPNPYFAILMADLDGLDEHLGKNAEQERHEEISERLAQISDEHRSSIWACRGAAVYSGGDDLMAFLPAAEALNAADDCRRAVLEEPTDLSSRPAPTSISAAVVFVHQGTPLHLSVERARELLEEAKKVNEKNAIAVGYVTGSGARAHTVRPWTTSHVDDALTALNTFMPRGEGSDERKKKQPLSPRLIGDLKTHRTDLAELRARSRFESMYEGEVTRLVLRHNGDTEQARALLDLGESEWTGSDGGQSIGDVPVTASRVAVFLRRHVR